MSKLNRITALLTDKQLRLVKEKQRQISDATGYSVSMTQIISQALDRGFENETQKRTK